MKLFPIHTFYRHHPRKRVIQYSVVTVASLGYHGVLDARLRGHDSE